MYTRIYQSISEIDADDWNRILGSDQRICTHGFLRSVEEANINDCEYAYPVVYDDSGNIIAHTCVYSITTDIAVFAKGAVAALIAGIRKIYGNFLSIRMLECGTPVALGSLISMRDIAVHEEIIGLINDAINEIADTRKQKLLLVRDYYEHNTGVFDKLTAYGFYSVPNVPDTLLEIRWDTFDEYVADMRSHYRRRVKLNIKKIKHRGITTEILDDFSEHCKLLERQYKNIFDKATEYKREILTAEFFDGINKNMGDSSKLVIYREDGEIIAHSLLLLEEDTIRFMYLGKEKKDTFDLVPVINYDTVRAAIKYKKKFLKMGITNYVAKTDMGAQLIPMTMYLKNKDAWFPWLIPWLFTKMTVLPDLQKNVFKH